MTLSGLPRGYVRQLKIWDAWYFRNEKTSYHLNEFTLYLIIEQSLWPLVFLAIAYYLVIGLLVCYL